MNKKEALGLPQISWNAQTRRLNASPAWEELSGYSSQEMFGSGFLSEHIKIESLLDDFIDRFGETVAEGDRVFVKAELKKLLILSNSSGEIRLKCKIISKKGIERFIKLYVATVWAERSLERITAIATEDERYLSASRPLTAPAKAQAEATPHRRVNKNMTTASLIQSIKALPLLLASIVATVAAFNDVIDQLSDEFWELFDRVSNPSLVRSPTSAWRDLPIDNATLQKIKSIMVTNRSPHDERIGLYQYEPTKNPRIITPLAISSSREEPVTSEELAPRSVSATEFIRGRTEEHVTHGRSLTITVGGKVQHSVPFSVNISHLEKENSPESLLLFLEITSIGTPSEVKDKAYELTQSISKAISEEKSSD